MILIALAVLLAVAYFVYSSSESAREERLRKEEDNRAYVAFRLNGAAGTIAQVEEQVSRIRDGLVQCEKHFHDHACSLFWQAHDDTLLRMQALGGDGVSNALESIQHDLAYYGVVYHIPAIPCLGELKSYQDRLSVLYDSAHRIPGYQIIWEQRQNRVAIALSRDVIFKGLEILTEGINELRAKR